jgi:hypothetical protein
LSRLQGGRFRGYTGTDTVWALYEDGDHVLWAGTEGGLLRVNGEQITRYTTAEGIFHDSSYGILEDSAGHLWFNTDRGIFRVRKSELNEFADGKRASVTHVAYGVADGMKTAECNGGTQPSSWRARDGRLWFATATGVVVVDPERMTETAESPAVLIEEVTVERQPLRRRHRDDIPAVDPDGRQFEFRFSAPGAATPERIRFRYRVDSVDPDWIEAGARREASYTTLPPGRHRFRVMAANQGDAWNETGAATFAFTVRPHFSQTWWFYVLCGLVTSTAVWSGHRLRLHRVVEMERVRMRIASDLHDDIGSSLSQIAILSEVARTIGTADGRISAPLERIGRLARESVDAMSDIVWAIDPHRDTPAHLATRLRRFASDLLPPRGIELRFASMEGATAPLGADVLRQVYLICKEAVHNAVRHGCPTRIEIELTANPRRLSLIVRDNGRGFDLASPRDGHGIRNMNQRAAAIAAALVVVSVPGEGTTVTVTVPV